METSNFNDGARSRRWQTGWCARKRTDDSTADSYNRCWHGDKAAAISRRQAMTVKGTNMKTTNQPDAPNASANNAEQNLQQGQQPQQDPQRAQQPQQDQSDICCNNGNSNWKQQVAAAKGIWGKLTEDELLKSEGEQQKLSSLVRVRYVLSRETADKQVREFLARPQASNTSAA